MVCWLQEYLEAAEALPASVDSEIRGRTSKGNRVWLGLGGPQGTATPLWWGLLTLWRYRSLTCYKRADYIAPRLLDKVGHRENEYGEAMESLAPCVALPC